MGVPCVISPHGSLYPYLYGQSRDNLVFKRVYEALFDAPNRKKAGAIHFAAEEERKRVDFLGLITKSLVVPLGIDWQSYRTLPGEGGFRLRSGVA